MKHKLIQRLREERKSRGLSQRALADLVGAHRTDISRFETGRQNMGFEMFLKVVQALGLRIELTSDHEKQPPVTIEERH